MTKTASWYINCAISLSLMIFVRFIPAPEPMTQLGMTAIGIFIGAIYGWCTTNMIWPSIAAIAMLAFTTNTTMPAIWGNLMSNGTVGIAFWLMLAVGFLSNTGLNLFADVLDGRVQAIGGFVHGGSVGNLNERFKLFYAHNDHHPA